MPSTVNEDLFCRSLLSLVPLTVFNAQPALSSFAPSSAPLSVDLRTALLKTFSPWQVYSEFVAPLVPRLSLYPAISSLYYKAPQSPHFRSLLLEPALPEFVFSCRCPICGLSESYFSSPQHGSYLASLDRLLCVFCRARLWPFF